MHWQPIEEASKDPGQVGPLMDLWVGFRMPDCYWNGYVWVGRYGDRIKHRITHFMVVRRPGEE